MICASGRVDITHETLDVLFDGVERIQRILSSDETRGRDGRAVRLAAPSASRRAVPRNDDVLREYELNESVLSVLTEYEEHRLRQNIAQGMTLYRLQCELRARLHRHGARRPQGARAPAGRADHLSAEHGRRHRRLDRARGAAREPRRARAAARGAVQRRRGARSGAAPGPREARRPWYRPSRTSLPAPADEALEAGRAADRSAAVARPRRAPTRCRCARSPTRCASTFRSSIT